MMKQGYIKFKKIKPCRTKVCKFRRKWLLNSELYVYMKKCEENI